MRDAAAEIVAGLFAAMQATGAKRGVICTKDHYHDAVASLQKAVQGKEGISLKLMKSTYPAGDEQVMVYEVTGKVVPTGGLPIDAGAVVLNVTTLRNIYRAMQGRITSYNVCYTKLLRSLTSRAKSFVLVATSG